ncbi:MAG: tRNA-uridine aminocarboxypropyltransferase [Pseudomonadota bacterium]
MNVQQRLRCDQCKRPAAACVCRWVRPIDSSVALLILQHPMEFTNAKGSARLLHLSVGGSVMLGGEQFAPDQLKTLLYADGRRPVLLYPQLAAMEPSRAIEPILLTAPEALRLVVLDGTWRKSRKMLYLNPLLQELPRLALSGMPPSKYRIRKAHAPDQLSTLEAGCHALGQLEGRHERYAGLLQAFDDFTAHFQATDGRVGECARLNDGLENRGPST